MASYGRFVSLGVIARGGMGIVLRARDPELDREVALKLLGPADWGKTGDTIGEQQLQREAQALAKLSHPNVVTVYEMGRIGDETFIAMELVDGVTLREWLEQEHSQREIIRAFIDCGRGLAAAHAAGLVHRDFKPENVLIGADHRPRVLDFGLVANGVAGPKGLTADGAIVGTPEYMAPEQWSGAAVDARTDQFAFCVAMWEALCGERPFATARDPIAAPKRRLPFERVLRRGLSRKPDDRWPSMDALLARLEPKRKTAWIAVPVVAGAVIAVVALRPSNQCAIQDDVWNRDAKAQVEAAFRDAPDQFKRVAKALDAYSAAWTAATIENCRRSDVLRDRRTLCLDRGRLAMQRIVTDLAKADRVIVERSFDAVARLPDLSGCSDVERLDAAIAPPTEPALRKQLQAIQQQLADAEGHNLRGDYAKALATNRAAVEAARALDHAPTLAAALNALGDTLVGGGQLVDAEGAYREATMAAAVGRDDLAAADAWTNVLFAVAERNEKLDAVAVLDPVAEAAVLRVGNPVAKRYRYLNASGSLAENRSDFATAYERFSAAITLAGTNLVWRAESTRNLANVIRLRDGASKAVDTARLAAQYMEQARGPDHPDTAAALEEYGKAANEASRYTEARPVLERVLAIEERTFGHDSIRVAQVLKSLGNVIMNLGDYPTARARYDDAIAIEDRLGAPEASRAISVAGLAVMLSDAGQREASLPYYTRALEMLEHTSGTGTVNYLMMSVMYSQALHHLNRCAEVAPILARIDAPLSKLPHLYPGALQIKARCAKAANQLPVAIAALEKASELCATAACEPSLPIDLRCELGMALYESGRDPKRGHALVEKARAEMIAHEPTSPMIREADDWLHSHR